jgi:hypothetical protein
MLVKREDKEYAQMFLENVERDLLFGKDNS